MKNESNLEISKVHYLYKQQPTYMLDMVGFRLSLFSLQVIFLI